MAAPVLAPYMGLGLLTSNAQVTQGEFSVFFNSGSNGENAATVNRNKGIYHRIGNHIHWSLVVDIVTTGVVFANGGPVTLSGFPPCDTECIRPDWQSVTGTGMAMGHGEIHEAVGVTYISTWSNLAPWSMRLSATTATMATMTIGTVSTANTKFDWIWGTSTAVNVNGPYYLRQTAGNDYVSLEFSGVYKVAQNWVVERYI